jgi:hypothetical protein
MPDLRPFLFVIAALLVPAGALAQPVAVELQQTEAGWQLLRSGEPYPIKGAGGWDHLATLADCGGNSIRTWGVGDETQALLDEAHRLGLTVTLGIWLGHERHGFDYNDFDSVAAQYEQVREAVLAYKDHPALLMWGIGNEMEGYEQGANPAIWSHIEACAALVKRLDPHHPTMTVIAEIGGRKIEAIHRLCPSIDIIGVNSYGGASSLPERYAQSGATKPYIVTEFGPPGPWELGRTDFGAAPEPTSTEKAEAYRAAYTAFTADTTNCLGSYAFLWGFKTEATTTWFGMFLPDGSRVATVDAMTACWTGSLPDNRCPSIEPLVVIGAAGTEPGATVRVALEAADPEGEPLDVAWTLMADPMTYVTAGDEIPVPPSYPERIVRSDADGCALQLPEAPGVYRLFVVVKDPAGNAATANLPLYVADNDPVDTDAIDLPAVVYAEADGEQPWIPSGYMGNAGAITMDAGHADHPRAGDTCLKVVYNSGAEWGGVVWQSPVNDWGDVEGGYDLSGARVLEFWARGEAGGEVVNFGFGLIGADKPFPDTARGSLEELRLTDAWRLYTIEIPEDADLRRIKTGFFWSLAGQGGAVTFYLDDIAFRSEPSED